MMEMVQNFAKDAEDINGNAEISLNVAKETKNIIEDSFNKFEDIRYKIQESKEYNKKVLQALDSLDEKIREIDTITEAVEGIASNTTAGTECRNRKSRRSGRVCSCCRRSRKACRRLFSIGKVSS